MVPSTNPFLKELLGINEVVTVLREVPMDAMLRAFMRKLYSVNQT
jgi:hypothetical protein